MLSSINPLGERARGNRWWVTVAWLTIGTVIAGVATGAVLGWVGQLLPQGSWRQVTLGVVAAAAAGWDLSARKFPIRRQVNKDWLHRYRSWVYGLGYGIQLGAGPVTVVNTALIPLFMLVALLAGIHGATIGALFGATRGLTTVLVCRVKATEDLQNLHRTLEGTQDLARRLSGAAAAAAAAAMVV